MLTAKLANLNWADYRVCKMMLEKFNKLNLKASKHCELKRVLQLKVIWDGRVASSDDSELKPSEPIVFQIKKIHTSVNHAILPLFTSNFADG